MADAIAAAGLNSFLNLGSGNNVSSGFKGGSHPSELKDLFLEDDLSSEELEQLRVLLPEGLLEGFEKQLAGGKMLPLLAADVAPTSIDMDASGIGSFPGLFTMLSQYQQNNPKAEVSLGGDEPSLGRSVPTAGLQELLVKLKLMLKADSTAGKGSLIAADYQDSSGSTSGFLLQKAAIPVANDVLQQQLASLAGKASFSTIDSGTLPVQHAATAITSLTSGFGGDGSPLGKEVADLAPPPLTAKTTDKGWDTLLGNRVMWMVGKHMQSASVKITPANMGPIEIKVAVQNDQATVSFVAQHGAVRDALEMAVPRLREMFNEGNLQLVNVDVNQKDAGDQHSLQNFSRQAQQDFDSSGEEGAEQDDGSAVEMEGGPIVVTTHDGFLDDYA